MVAHQRSRIAPQGQRALSQLSAPAGLGSAPHAGDVCCLFHSLSPIEFLDHQAHFPILGKIGVLRGNYNTIDVGANGRGIDMLDFKKAMGPIQRTTVLLRQTACERGSANRKRAAALYRQHLEPLTLAPLEIDAAQDPVILKYPVLVANKPAVLAAAESAKVELSDNYSTPVHPYAGQELRLMHYELGSCPQAEYKAQHVVALPCSASWSERDTMKAIAFLRGGAP